MVGTCRFSRASLTLSFVNPSIYSLVFTDFNNVSIVAIILLGPSIGKIIYNLFDHSSYILRSSISVKVSQAHCPIDNTLADSILNHNP